ncbi:MAG: iron-containing alcohol dehydrogenase [Ferroplasma sp.]|uniref:iron-containing alcohol dehydrogenase n=1 Tax=Ferroplasma sp. TaxID=2591003 RepID=UPI0028166BCC|nr:iron-containing alcohol dehydrogenase [Ferroplasma sp.]WMT50517.1 MAG: iron-containing alcohol dehydrogenase [Ferroplasma sp.]
MWFFRSPSIVFGEESLSFLGTLDAEKIAIITDKNIVNSGLITRVEKNLPANSEKFIVSDILPEPDYDNMLQHINGIKKFGPDLFIGVGGGSSMDTAKILFALYERPDISIYDITPLVKLNLRKKSHLIAIPTTSGTGSECSWAAVVSEKNEHRKNELASPEILPDYAILDPEMVLSLPREQTVNTSVDAITHAVEAYVAKWANPYSDALAEKALELISNNILNVLKKPGDIESRNNVHIGASMAGMSFSNSQIGLAHALGHSFGAVFKIAHGKTVGLFLPEVIRYNYSSSKIKYDKLNSILPDSIREDSLDLSIENLFGKMGQPVTMDALNINEDEYKKNFDLMVELAENSTGIITNPEDIDRNGIEAIFNKVHGD